MKEERSFRHSSLQPTLQSRPHECRFVSITLHTTSVDLEMDIFSPDPSVVVEASGVDPEAIFARDSEQCTPLAAAIKHASTPLVHALLEKCDAAASAFVHGHTEGSIVCCLPMTIQPHSTVYNHPEPLKDVDPAIIRAVDEHLADHVGKMVAAEKAETADEKVPDPTYITRDNADLLRYSAEYSDLQTAFGTNEDKLWNHWNTFGKKESRKMYQKSSIGSAGPPPPAAPAAPVGPPFNHYPPQLKTGDIGDSHFFFAAYIQC